MQREGLWQTQFGKLLTLERRVADRLPYSVFVSPEIIALRDGTLMAMLEVGGFEFESVGSVVLRAHKEAFAVLLRTMGSQYALYNTVIRRKQVLVPEHGLPPGFATDLDDAWYGSLATTDVFQNHIYFTIIRANPTARMARLHYHALTLLGEYDREERRAAQCLAVTELQETARHFARQFVDYDVRILGEGLDTVPEQPEQLRVLSQILGHDDMPIVLSPEKEICDALPTRRIHVGKRTIERHGPSDAVYSAVISIDEYRADTWNGILIGLLDLPCEFVLTQTFAGMPNQKVRGMFSRHEGQALQGGNTTFADMMRDAQAALERGELIYGMHHCTVVPTATSREALEHTAVPAITTALAQCGFVPRREDLGMEAGFWAQMPGNFRFIARPAPISSNNFAGMGITHRYAEGNRNGSAWGPPLTVLKTAGGTPYYVNLHTASENGSTCVIGSTRSGKTTLMAFLLSQSLKYGGRRFILDKGRGWYGAVAAHNGVYSAIERGVPTGINPLQMEDTAANRLFTAAWVSRLLTAGLKRELTSDDETVVRTAVNHLFENFVARERRFGILQQLLGERSDFGRALEVWSGDYGWVFDNPTHTLDFRSPLSALDIGVALDDDMLRAPMVMYLLYMIEQYVIDGIAPCVVVLEEGWKALQDPIFADRAGEWVRTIGKRNGEVWFITQDPESVALSPQGWLIYSQSANKIFFPDPNARRDMFIEKFGLTSPQYELLRSMRTGARTVFYRPNIGSPVLLRFDLSSMPAHLAILAGTDELRKDIEKLQQLYGSQSNDWLPHFKARYEK